jgi:starvation-inducible DNA-binding protein
MSKSSPDNRLRVSAQPRLHQHGVEIQAYGTVRHALPLDLEEVVRLEVTERLNQLLADTFTLRDLYKEVSLASCWAYLLPASSPVR